MGPEDVSAFLKNVPLKTLIEALAILDPDMVQVFNSIEMVRKNGYGKVNIVIAHGQIMEIAPEVKFRLRDDKKL